MYQKIQLPRIWFRFMDILHSNSKFLKEYFILQPKYGVCSNKSLFLICALKFSTQTG